MNKQPYHKYRPRKAVPLEDKITPRMRELAAQALQEQLSTNDPPFVRENLQRLMEAGVPERQAKDKILGVLTRHLYDVMQKKHRFNENRYGMELEKLK